MVIRGCGVVAFTLLAGSSIRGLLVSTKVLGRAVKAKSVRWFHESLGLGALVAIRVIRQRSGSERPAARRSAGNDERPAAGNQRTATAVEN